MGLMAALARVAAAAAQLVWTDQEHLYLTDNAYLPNRSLHDRSIDRANKQLFARSVVFPMSLRNWLFLPFF